MRIKEVVLLALSAGLLFGLASQAGPQPDYEKALRGASPEEAVRLAKLWRQEGRKVVSFLTPTHVQFELPTGARVRVDLPKDRMAVAVAPYQTFTHPCEIHYFSSCTGEMKGARFQVRVLEGERAVFEGEVQAGADGFFELWLPRNKRLLLEVRYQNQVARAPIATFADSPTCLTGLRLR